MEEMSYKRTPSKGIYKSKSYIESSGTTINCNARIAIQKKNIWENLSQVMTHLGKCKTYKELLLKLPKQLDAIMEYDKMSIMLISNCFSSIEESKEELAKERVLVKRVFFGGAWYKLIHGANHQLSDPQYSNFTQLGIGRKKYV